MQNSLKKQENFYLILFYYLLRMSDNVEWSKGVRKKLIDLGMSRRDLAREIGVNYSVMCAVINGNTTRESVRVKINDFLNIKEVIS